MLKREGTLDLLHEQFTPHPVIGPGPVNHISASVPRVQTQPVSFRFEHVALGDIAMAVLG